MLTFNNVNTETFVTRTRPNIICKLENRVVTSCIHWL